jgi:hypothetical protein
VINLTRPLQWETFSTEGMLSQNGDLYQDAWVLWKPFMREWALVDHLWYMYEYLMYTMF